jgi:hypothetical protein
LLIESSPRIADRSHCEDGSSYWKPVEAAALHTKCSPHHPAEDRHGCNVPDAELADTIQWHVLRRSSPIDHDLLE